MTNRDEIRLITKPSASDSFIHLLGFKENEVAAMAKKGSRSKPVENLRKQAKEALQISLTKYQTLFETLPLGVTISDEAGNIIECNREAERLLGLPREKHAKRMIDGPEWRIIRPDGSPMPADEYASVRALKENRLIKNVEMGIVKGVGDVTWINVTAAPIPLKGYGVAIVYSDITERKKIEKDLILEQFSVNHVPDSIAWITQDTRFLHVNDAWCRSLGYSRDELTSMDIFDVDPDFTEEDWPGLWEKMKKESPLILESRHRRKDGSIFPVEITANYMMVNGKEYHLGIARDITERKRAEEALQQSEEMYRNLVENISNVIYEIDSQGVVIYVSPVVKNIVEYEPSDIIGKDFIEFIYEDDRDRMMKRFLELHEGIEYTSEFRFISKSGEIRWVRTKSKPIMEGGIFKGARGMFINITERKIMEDALRKSEGQYRSLIESTKDSIYLLDRDLRYLFANMAYLERVGLTLQQLIGRSYLELHPFPNDSFPGYVNDVITEGNRKARETAARTLSEVYEKTGLAFHGL